MKVKNLLLAGMIAFGFASCSSDNDPISVETGDEDTMLSISFGAVTKADDNNKEIKDFTVLLDGVVLTKVDSGSNELVNFEISEYGTKELRIVANTTATSGTVNIATEDPDYPTMSSDPVSISIQKGKHHYVGYTSAEVAEKATTLDKVPFHQDGPIKLYRNVARVVLEGITFNPDADFKAEYPNAKFKLKKVYITQGNETSNLLAGSDFGGAEDANSAFVTGFGKTSYDSMYDKIEELTTFKYLWAPKDNVKPFTKYAIAAVKDPIVATGSIDLKTDNVVFYAYENTKIDPLKDILTLLTIEGEFSYDGINFSGATPYYSLAVGVTGTVAGNPEDNKGVFHNHQYNINVNLKGNGSDTPWVDDSKTLLDVQVEVVPYGEVKQIVDID